MKCSSLNKITLAAALLAGGMGIAPGQSATPSDLQQIKTVFVIAMENHNFVQPNPLSSPEQIFTNPAAPYLNSLITPGNPNAAWRYSYRYFWRYGGRNGRLRR